MSLLRPRSRFLCRFSLRHRRAIHRLVTPFTPFLICDYYVSSEIHSWGVRNLNRRARSLRFHAGRVRENDIVYCQSDMIEALVTRYLPRIPHSFVLITGKYRMPGVQNGPAAEALLRSDKVRLWFSQNACFGHDKCRVFPYGIRHFDVADVLDAMRAEPAGRRDAIYYGYAGIHGHLEASVRQDRLCLVERMEDRVPLQNYLAKLRTHRFVASPQGDRPDTHRHWEALAMGCVPISNLPRRPWEQLFGPHMVYLREMHEILTLDPAGLDVRPAEPERVTVAYWSNVVARALAH